MDSCKDITHSRLMRDFSFLISAFFICHPSNKKLKKNCCTNFSFFNALAVPLIKWHPGPRSRFLHRIVAVARSLTQKKKGEGPQMGEGFFFFLSCLCLLYETSKSCARAAVYLRCWQLSNFLW